MNRSLWAVALLGAILLQGAAAAAYGPGSALEAEAPILLDGRVDALLPNGIASFVSNDPKTSAVLLLTAREANVTYREVADRCTQASPVPVPCGTQVETRDASVTLREARIQVTRALTAYKVIVTNDRSYAGTPSFGAPGELVLRAGGSTLLGSNRQALQTSGFESDWTPHSSKAPAEPVYAADALSGQLAATGGLLRATGGFETFLQGFEVKVTGTGSNGEAFEKTYLTPMPKEGEAFRYLVVEAGGATLHATSAAPLSGFAPPDQRPVFDVWTRASFRDAMGTVTQDGEKRAHEGEDVALDGPLSLTLVQVRDAETVRLGVTLVDGLALLAAAPPEDRDDPAPLLVAGAAGAGGAGLLIGLAYFWPRLRFGLTALFLPLYSRIERSGVLEHEKRDEIYELIRATPGIHAHEIGERTNIGWGTTVYHLKLLENHSLVVSKKSGRYKRFFVNTGEYTRKKEVYGALRNETAKSVAEYIVNHPGTSQKDMCAALGIQPSLASWHVEKLEGVELVKRVKDGRQVRYFAGPAWSQMNVRVNPAGGADTPAES